MRYLSNVTDFIDTVARTDRSVARYATWSYTLSGPVLRAPAVPAHPGTALPPDLSGGRDRDYQ
ncbi:hypothetical protein GCM10009106_27790 [Sphingomonas japonica]